MEATAVSVGKAVLDGVLGYAKSAIADEVAWQLGVQCDQAFIRDELQMMQAFLMAAHEERDGHRVIITWVKQVRDVAYDVEDCLQYFAVRLGKPSWWRIPCTLLDRRHVAKQMKELRAKVEDVSQRNMRYRLIKGSDTKTATSTRQYSIAGATMFGMEEAWRLQDKAKLDLSQLINMEGMDLKVIAVWGTSGVLGQTAVIKRVYNDMKTTKRFGCYAWIRIMHPFSPSEFLQCIMRQFYVEYLEEAGKTQEKTTLGAQVLKKMGMIKQNALVAEFNKHVNEKSYLIVLNDLSNIEEWDWIKTYFPNNKKGSRIIVSTGQAEIASLCTEQDCVVYELKQSFVDQDIFAFCDEGTESSNKKDNIDFWRGTRKAIESMRIEELKKELSRLLEGKRCLIVLDDLSSTVEWDLIIQSFPTLEDMSRIIVTTREENIAKHCSNNQENIMLKVLEDNDALDLFTKKVFKGAPDLDKHPELIKEAKLILKKCNGLPLAIVTIGGFLAKQPKTPMEWRKLNEHISAELEINSELEMIKNVLIQSYDGLPYHLKHCFLYLSIFSEDYNISRRRLVHRWTAEGYSSEVRGKPMEVIADSYFMELIDRSMILPSQQSVSSRKGIDSCKVHDLMREISISKSVEENLVFRLEAGCSLETQGIVRHLTINSNWEGDKGEFESTVNLSRIRSLTVYGKWRKFFISEKMSLLRVLDLENTIGLSDRHLERIGRLLLLKYLSLRGCKGIFRLPDSLGNLKQLQTLDIAYTRIIKLPKTIIKLRKLQYIRAGRLGISDSYKELVEDLPKLAQAKLCLLALRSMGCCVLCRTSQHRKKLMRADQDPDRRDICAYCCYSMLPILTRRLNPCGVVVPRGFSKLRALHTLGVVDIAGGMTILKDIRGFTRLRKLAVTGVNKKNCQEFCSALADLSSMESLSLHSEGKPGLHGCLDGVSSPPENLQGLKLVGNLVELPGWIGRLQNLVKLKLHNTWLTDMDATIQIIGKLPNLAILGLWTKSFHDELRLPHLTFHPEAFLSLMVLELDYVDNEVRLVEFEEGAMPKLELLLLKEESHWIRGLSSLPSLKEVQLQGHEESFVDAMQAQLSTHPKKPVLKRL
ncbi:disease resistance protein Pik-2 isoform X2 [Setaria viridis]|uniref:disease resistance protein Pik-2 isoform X2 n=1 Tax=Setaria viridis TaxID=4556 RepID=UPI001493C4FA|nr:disease resistance protein Pik-2-like isoform X2 [Setaria viridis]